jgi:hypothetical protein
MKSGVNMLFLSLLRLTYDPGVCERLQGKITRSGLRTVRNSATKSPNEA